MKFAYVVEDGEIVKKQEIAKIPVDELEFKGNIEVATYLCDRYFEEEYHEVDWEINGLLFTVSETEMVFLTNVNTSDVEILWK